MSEFHRAEDIIFFYEKESVANHLFWQHLKSQPPNLSYIWILVANLYEGISKNFVRWIAHIVSTVEDDRIRCLIASQLDEELGEGDYSRAHRLLLERFLEGLEPWKPETVERLLIPGEELGKQAGKYYLSRNPYEALGAALVGEVLAKQFDTSLYEEIKRQDVHLNPWYLTWLTLHAELEVHHADDSLALARLIPQSNSTLEAVSRGAMGMSAAFRGFLTDLYKIYSGQVNQLQAISVSSSTQGNACGSSGDSRAQAQLLTPFCFGLATNDHTESADQQGFLNPKSKI